MFASLMRLNSAFGQWCQHTLTTRTRGQGSGHLLTITKNVFERKVGFHLSDEPTDIVSSREDAMALQRRPSQRSVLKRLPDSSRVSLSGVDLNKRIGAPKVSAAGYMSEAPSVNWSNTRGETIVHLESPAAPRSMTTSSLQTGRAWMTDTRVSSYSSQHQLKVAVRRLGYALSQSLASHR